MQTFEANRAAVCGRTQAVRRALISLGMRRCSTSLVEHQWRPPIAGQRISWYCAFWRWFEALWLARREGAEFLFEDFCARVEALRGAGATNGAEHRAQLERCEARHSDLVRAALTGADSAHLRRKVIENIVENRRLLAALTEATVKHRAA